MPERPPDQLSHRQGLEITALVVVSLLAGLGLILTPLSAAGAHETTGTAARPVTSPTARCAVLPPSALVRGSRTPRPQGPSSAKGRSRVALVVPPVTVAIVDARGRPLKAWTNTGRPPACRGYRWACKRPASLLLRACSLRQVNGVLSRRLLGRWRPGIWRVLSG
jgi:hypothetical protein